MSLIPPFIVAIPARFGSTRLPGKPLRLIAGKPMVVQVARRAHAAGAAEVVVATDDIRIASALGGIDAKICMTNPNHGSGSDRLAECADQLGWADHAIVVNLQGDEPLAPPAGIRAVVEALVNSQAPIATLATPIIEVADLFNPHCVKVVCDLKENALYFTRAPVPFARDEFSRTKNKLPKNIPFLRHIGIYAYRAGFLRQFAQLSRTPLEQAESLEQLRALEHGYSITVGLAPEPFPAGVDTEEDLLKIQQWFGKNNLS